MKYILSLVFTMSALAALAQWRGLDESNWYSGPKISEEDLAGKVVMVDEWGVNCPPCRALLPEMEKIWKKYKSKPFVLIGSHRQGHRPDQVKALVEANKLTYPIYDFAGIAVGEPDNGRAIPFIYVLNHRGKVVYSGRSDRDAVQAVENALAHIGGNLALTADVDIKYHKNLEKNLVLGKSIQLAVKQLEREVAAFEKTNSASAKETAKAEEAKELLKAIEEAKTEIKMEIAAKAKTNPAEAQKMAKQFKTTWPNEKLDF